MAGEGQVQAGDDVTIVERAAESVSIAEFVGLYRMDQPDRELLRRLATLAALPESLRTRFKKELRELDA